MPAQIPLSTLVHEVQSAIDERFSGKSFWVSAQITNVKKQENYRRCYLTLEDYENGKKLAQIRAVVWSNYYNEIERFESQTGELFQSGKDIVCRVNVRFYPVYGLNADIVEIDAAHTLGSLELERRKTLERLVKENPQTIQFFDGKYITQNNRISLPSIIKNIALITAPNSDGQRDFLEEISKNKHNYSFHINQFLTTIQGEKAHFSILEKLREIKNSSRKFDAVAIVRGGGSQSDFKVFDEYDLAREIAHFPVPVFTGIGHDRNQSIADQMARQLKTPTKAASFFVEHNFDFEERLIRLSQRLSEAVDQRLSDAENRLANIQRILKISSPESVLEKGFAILKVDGKIVTAGHQINENKKLQSVLKESVIESSVTKIIPK